MNNSEIILTYKYDLTNDNPSNNKRLDGMKNNTLQEYQNYLAARHRKEYTRRYYYDTIRKLLQDTNKNIDTLTKNDIDQWLTQQNQKKLKTNTLIDYIIRINMFLNWTGHPEWRIKKPHWIPTTRDILTLPEIIRLRETSKKISPEHYLITILITDLNTRPSEICELRYQDRRQQRIHNTRPTTSTNGIRKNQAHTTTRISRLHTHRS